MDYLPVVKRLGFRTIHQIEALQVLWGGYGELVRVFVDDTSIVIKHVRLPKPEQHPRGWNTDFSHQRKLKSYEVELYWYQNYASLMNRESPVPASLCVEHKPNEWLLVMEDLSASGFTEVVKEADQRHLGAVLRWLAYFHAQHIQNSGDGLWQSGTYWHIETRPDELEALTDQPLKAMAEKVDHALKCVPYQTLVHGDAKLANFCFTSDGLRAAAVDFQYVGKGCAMKDVALFMSSAVKPAHCQKMENWILDEYFKHLNSALTNIRPEIDADEVEKCWRPMFAIAWADFQRFVKGWSPEHWKINAYTEGLKNKALEQLKAY
ncbi:phosphotransferase [Vibrio japonicus]|uniref:Phosphotransferase n=2 Tax=Vibrio japonicus TaxID=1824638 RepID=A0ABY5LQM7_9VIBR|nr:phosphotransferase [Vibrio japonicus]UUM33158.1 phosphotransferase [Vibrio japonicus]